MVQRSLKVGSGAGRALAVQDVHAPPDVVWSKILDFDNYKNMVPKVSQCSNYQVEHLRNGTDIIKTRMLMNVFGVKFDNYIYHTHFKSLDSLTWTLDYSRKSTLDDSVGFWYVTRPPDRQTENDWSRVYYSCLLTVPKWVPGIVVGFLEKKAVAEANLWLKRESEAKWAKDQASGKTAAPQASGGGGLFSNSKPSSAGGFFGWGAKPQPEVVQPEPVVEIEEEPSELPRKVLKVARKAATFGAGYGVGWLAHSRFRTSSRSSDIVQVDIQP
jgi:hypothetical protein